MSAVVSDNSRPQTPAHAPRARWMTIIVGVLLLVIAAVAARALYVHYTRPAGWEPWLNELLDVFRAPDPLWVLVGGVFAILLGIGGLIAAVLPRNKPYRQLSGTGSSIWVRRVDVARYSTATAKRFPGVVSASTLAKKKSVIVTAQVINPDDALRYALHRELTETLSAIFGEELSIRVQLQDSSEDDAMLAPAEPAGSRNGGDSHES